MLLGCGFVVPERLLKKGVEGLYDRICFLPILRVQQASTDQLFDFSLPQIDLKAAQPVTTSLAMPAHALRPKRLLAVRRCIRGEIRAICLLLDGCALHAT